MRPSQFTITAALALTALPLTWSAITLAATAPAPSAVVAPPKLDPQDQALLKFSDAGQSAARDVRDARLAIFQGEPKLAMTFMESANKQLALAEKDAPAFSSTSKMMVNGKTVEARSQNQKEDRVPVDGQLSLADNFVLTPEKQAHIAKANAHIKQGNRDKALEELKLGEIDVNYTRWWLPMASSAKHLNQAIKLATDGKYYEANLALKAIEDSMTVDSVTFSDLPKSVGTAKKP